MAAGRTACVQWPTYYDAMAAWRSSVADVMAMAPSLQEEVRPRGRGAPARRPPPPPPRRRRAACDAMRRRVVASRARPPRRSITCMHDGLLLRLLRLLIRAQLIR
jgi:hypothetical protein